MNLGGKRLANQQFTVNLLLIFKDFIGININYMIDRLQF